MVVLKKQPQRQQALKMPHPHTHYIILIISSIIPSHEFHFVHLFICCCCSPNSHWSWQCQLNWNEMFAALVVHGFNTKPCFLYFLHRISLVNNCEINYTSIFLVVFILKSDLDFSLRPWDSRSFLLKQRRHYRRHPAATRHPSTFIPWRWNVRSRAKGVSFARRSSKFSSKWQRQMQRFASSQWRIRRWIPTLSQ